MTMHGVGFAQAGISIGGIGQYKNPTGVDFQILPDSEAVQQDECFIDPETRDYVFDQYGNVVGMSAIAQRVFLALSTTLGSSINPTLGNTLLQDIKFLPREGYDSKVVDIVQAALKELLDAKLISLISIETNVAGSRLNITVNWRDNTSDTNNSTNF